MNPTLMVVIITLVAVAAGRWLAERPWTKARVFAAVFAWLASVSILARPGPAGAWFYVAAVIGASMGTALLMAGIRRWSTVGSR